MTKFVSLCLAFLMVVSILPNKATASEVSRSRKEELLSLACDVFPEYAASIRSESASIYGIPRTENADKVIISETRNITETQSLTYAQYASGRSVVVNMVDDSSLFDPDLVKDEFTNFTGGKYGTVSIEVATNASGLPGVFSVTNFKYKIYDNTFDQITSLGTATMSKRDGIATGSWAYSLDPIYNEDSTSAASAIYDVTFYYMPGTGGSGASDSRNEWTKVSLNVHNNSVNVVVN